MKKQQREHLKKRGWNEIELDKIERVLDKPSKHEVHFSQIVFWSALIVVLLTNLAVSLILVFFLVALQQWILYAIIILLALSMGSLYKFLITDIGHLEKKHHYLAGIIFPVIAFANVVVMVLASNAFIKDVGAENAQHNPWLAGAVFAGVFILPYAVSQLRKF